METTYQALRTDPQQHQTYCAACRAAFDGYWNDWCNYNIHHSTFAELHKSATEVKCQACSRLLLRFFKVVDEEKLDRFAITLQLSQASVGPPINSCTSYSYSAPQKEIEIKFDRQWVHRIVGKETYIYAPYDDMLSIRFDILPVFGKMNPLRRAYPWNPPEILSRPLGESSGSRETLEIIHFWMENCQRYHPRCNISNRVPWMPTRLLDLMGSEDSDDIRLCITSEEKFSATPMYCTLTHRWATDHPNQLKLNKGNIERLRAKISLEELSTTFRQAVQVCKGLGFRYLWIDSLCIQQDNIEDWNQEGGLMANVYKNCEVNISAGAAAVDPMGGCFRSRGKSIRPYQMQKLQNKIPGEWFHVVASRFWQENVDETEIQRRGWVLQERILAPRVLHYAYEQVFWECRQVSACETIPLGIEKRGRFPEIELKDFRPGVALEQDSEAAKDALYPDQMRRVYWKRVVEAFSACNLTFANDKLVALSGIASAWQYITKAEYLAGLWRHELPLTLLWGVKSGQIAPCRNLELAPSWSWASIEGAVTYPALDVDFDSKSLVEIVEAKVTLVSEANRFGGVRDGSLKVRGMLIWAEWEVNTMEALSAAETEQQVFGHISNRRSSFLTKDNADLIPESSTSFTGYLSLDGPNGSFDGEGYYLPVKWPRYPSFSRGRGRRMTGYPDGLVLSEQADGSFLRIGKMTMASTEYIEQLPLMDAEITIK